MKIDYTNGYSDCLHDILSLVDTPQSDDFYKFIKINKKSLIGLVKFLIKHIHRFMMVKGTFGIKVRYLNKGTKKETLEFSPAESELREKLDYKGAIDMLNEERKHLLKATGDKFFEGDIKYDN